MPNKAEAKVGSVDKKTAKAEKVIKNLHQSMML